MIPKRLLKRTPPEIIRPRIVIGFVDFAMAFVISLHLGKIFIYPKVDRVMYRIPQFEFYWRIWRKFASTEDQERALGLPHLEAGWFKEKPTFKINKFDPVYFKMLDDMKKKTDDTQKKRRAYAAEIMQEYLQYGRLAVRANRLKKTKRALSHGYKAPMRYVGTIYDQSYFEPFTQKINGGMKESQFCGLCFAFFMKSYWNLDGESGVASGDHECKGIGFGDGSLMDAVRSAAFLRKREAEIKDKGFLAVWEKEEPEFKQVNSEDGGDGLSKLARR